MARERIPRVIDQLSAYINMTADYLLAGDGEKNWERLGMQPERLAKWLAFRDAWNKCYQKYSNKAVERTTAVIDELKKIKKEFIAFAQPAIEFIGSTPRTTIDDLETFNIKRGVLRKTSFTKIKPAETHPVAVSIDRNQTAMHILRRKDSKMGKSGKPPGTAFCEVAIFIGNAAPASVDECKKRAHSGRVRIIIKHDIKDSGKTAYYFLRWISRKGQAGPWSHMFSAVIS